MPETPATSTAEADDLTDDMALDLEAAFNVMQDEIESLMVQAEREHWSYQQLQAEITKRMK